MKRLIIYIMSRIANFDIMLYNEREKLIRRRKSMFARKDWICGEQAKEITESRYQESK